jgi:hypothetical protein
MWRRREASQQTSGGVAAYLVAAISAAGLMII